ncbi:MAG TPA: hypothetical protein VK907_10280, partial [Phnomibacter sp.]|nr:hypothetical protein [Phnomibacter sp.]
LVGGTVGGYISFAGAHRMLDAGVMGKEDLKEVDTAAVGGILLAGVMRILLFAAVAGVVAQGVVLPEENPAAKVFATAAGQVGLVMFGVILWAAAITSVVAAAYTSVTFISSVSAWVMARQRLVIIAFILVSTITFLFLSSPTKLLVIAGTINGLVLPVALASILLALGLLLRSKAYHHPRWLTLSGWAAVFILGAMSVRAVFLYFVN